jgi:BASS family bile acid:Na+ symporter
MDVKSLLPLAVQGSLMLLIFAIGLQSRWPDLVYALKRPGLLARGILAVNLIVPAIAILMCMILPVAPPVKAGLVIMSVSPLAPFAPGKMHKAGAEFSYATGLYVALILIAVVLVPVTVALLSALFGHDLSLPVSAIAPFVVTSVLLPILAGVLIGSLRPEFGRRAAAIATIAAYVVLLPVIVILLVAAGGKLLALFGDGTLIVIVVTVIVALAAGHWLGGPEPAQRTALAQAAATRHPGIAGLIAHRHFDDPRVMLAIVLFLLTSVILTGVYQSRVSKQHPAAAPAAA